MQYTRIGLLLFVFFASALQAAEVKLSASGICHDQTSPWYERTRNFSPFPSLEACLAAGGRLPAGHAANSSSSSNQSEKNREYRRDHFGPGWLDTDGDCQDARQEALIAQSTAPVRLNDSGCKIIAGRWISPFSGKVIHDPSRIDIDHVVPLKWAWEHGAQSWIQAERERFANDPVNLLSVEASLNRSKGAKGILEWLPPTAQCQYVLRFLRVLRLYDFELSSTEREAHQQLRQRLCDS